MGIIVDLIIVAIILLCILVGYKKGLTGSLIKLVSFVVSIVLAFMLYKPVANLVVENTQIDDNIEKAIIETLGAKETETTEETKSTSILDNISKNIEKSTAEAREEIVEATAKETTTTIIYIGSGLAIFIVARLALFIISLFAHGITSLPIIKQIDKIGGIAYGAIEGLLIVYIVLLIISLISVVWVDNPIVPAITKSTLGNMLYTNNIILKLF